MCLFWITKSSASFKVSLSESVVIIAGGLQKGRDKSSKELNALCFDCGNGSTECESGEKYFLC